MEFSGGGGGGSRGGGGGAVTGIRPVYEKGRNQRLEWQCKLLANTGEDSNSQLGELLEPEKTKKLKNSALSGTKKYKAGVSMQGQRKPQI